MNHSPDMPDGAPGDLADQKPGDVPGDVPTVRPGDVLVVPQLSGPLDHTVQVPGSKSIANRALVCAALARGTSRLSNVPDGDDVSAMIDGLRELGCGVRGSDPVVDDLGARSIYVSGWGGPVPGGRTTVNAKLAGTTSRFLVGLAATSTGPITIDGSEALRHRPFGVLVEALRELDVDVDQPGVGELPIVVSGPAQGGRISLRGDVSSQFISSLMMIGPVIAGGLTIVIDGELVSRPYVEMTASVMGRFGAQVVVDHSEITIVAGEYRPCDLVIEPDASSASYPLGLAAMVGGTVVLEGLGSASLQGDARFAELLEQMGCAVDIRPDATTVTRSPGADLRGIDIDMADISDLVPTLAAVAATAVSETRIRGVGFIRRKESDRLGDLAREWNKVGVRIQETDDGLNIAPSRDSLHAGRVGTHHDHRIAMATAILGVTAPGIEIDDPGVVSKSWPGFWTMLAGLSPS